MIRVGTDLSFDRQLMVLEHFRHQLSAVSEVTTLELLRAFQDKPFMNAEARAVLGAKRQATWSKLALLVSLGFLWKRGHMYRLTPFAKEFVVSAAATLQGLVVGERPAISADASEALKVAAEGLDLLYSKGRLSQSDYAKYGKALGEMSNVGRA